MFENYHLHSSFSPDSRTTPETQLRAVELLGIKEICFTDHVERYEKVYPEFRPDISNMIHVIRALHSDTVTIKVGTGARMHNYGRDMDLLYNMLDGSDLDFVIASLHFLDGYSVSTR